jgi:hypothetical protein
MLHAAESPIVSMVWYWHGVSPFALARVMPEDPRWQASDCGAFRQLSLNRLGRRIRHRLTGK